MTVQTKEITYGPATITVRRATVRDNMTRRALARELSENIDDSDNTLSAEAWEFVTLISRTDSVEGAGWELRASVSNGTGSLYDSFMAYLELDGGLVESWKEAVLAINLPPGDPETRPTDALSEEQLADPLSPSAESAGAPVSESGSPKPSSKKRNS